MDLCRRTTKKRDKKRKSLHERSRNRVKWRVRKGKAEVVRRKQSKL